MCICQKDINGIFGRQWIILKQINSILFFWNSALFNNRNRFICNKFTFYIFENLNSIISVRRTDLLRISFFIFSRYNISILGSIATDNLCYKYVITDTNSFANVISIICMAKMLEPRIGKLDTFVFSWLALFLDAHPVKNIPTIRTIDKIP